MLRDRVLPAIALALLVAIASAAPVRFRFLGGAETLDVRPVIGNSTLASHVGARDSGGALLLGRRSSGLIVAGFGPDPGSNHGWLSDAWTLDLDTLNSTWLGVTAAANRTGIYAQNSPLGPTHPGSRSGPCLFATNRPDVVALFAGFGYAAAPWWARGKLNDLWLLNTTTAEWAWAGGANATDPVGNYAPGGWPGGRVGPACWSAPASAHEVRLVMWGGWGLGREPDQRGPLSDLWQLQLAVGCLRHDCRQWSTQWTWLGGSQTISPPCNTSSSAWPCPRYAPGVATIDSDGYIFGGWGQDERGQVGDIGDLWVLRNLTSWERLDRGSVVVYSKSIGALGECAQVNRPSARYEPLLFALSSAYNPASPATATLGLFGGSDLSDVWLWWPNATAIGGNSTVGSGGCWMWVGGSQNQTQSTALWPGGRYGSAAFVRERTLQASGSMTLFGGFGLGFVGQSRVGVRAGLADWWEMSWSVVAPGLE